MSGLAVVFHRDGRPVLPSVLAAMLAAVPYRGPDGTAVWLADAVGLGHAKMAVSPEEEGERQPVVSPRTGCVLVADARLDNRGTLLTSLGEQPWSRASDAELILRAYETWGTAAAARLLGDFAFVIWDPQHHRLVAARDATGQRALFYRVDRRTFAAASEIHQLLQDPSVPVEPNEDRIRDFLVPLNIYRNEKDDSATFFRGIHALAAGQSMVVDRETVRVQRHWELRPAELRYRTDGDYAEHYRELFFEAVRARLRSACPMGALLSGGLDSASVVCTAQELYRAERAVDHGFTALSVVFDAPECDERDFVQDVEAKYGLRVHYLRGDRSAERLRLVPCGFVESPQVEVGAARDALMAVATRVGARAVLTGEVADSFVGGSRLVFDSLLRQGKVRTFLRHWQAYRRLSSEALHKTIALSCLTPLLPLGLQHRASEIYLRRAIQRNRRRLLPSWMPPALRGELGERHLALCLAAERGRRFGSPAREAEYRLLYPPEVARHPAPWPVEIWRPFADRRLHEFMLAIPPEQKFEPHPATDDFYAGSKQVVRRAMRGILPESIRARTSKTVFRGVFEDEVASHWTTYASAFGPSAKPEVARRAYVEPRLFWQRLQELRDGRSGADLIYVMQIVGLESWLRTFALPRPQRVAVPSARVEGARPAVARVRTTAGVAGGG